MRSDDTMRVLQLIDHDAQFAFNQNQSGIDPVILNKIDLTAPDFTEQLTSLIFSDSNGGDFVAKCECGAIKGDQKIGMVCGICETTVSKANLLHSNNLICKNWLSAPDELVYGWLTPKIYLNLATWLSYGKNKRNYLDDILDVDSELPFELVDIIDGRGFTYLYENFDRIISYFVWNHPVISRKPDTPAMSFLLNLKKDIIFSRYVPILNSAINPIITSDGVGANKRQYSDVTADHAFRAAVSLSRLEFSSRRKKDRLKTVERTAYKAFKDIILYVEDATKKYISTKKAIPRTHIFGSRFHLSFRAVVVPIIGDHLYHELHVPWQMAVNTLRVHLRGILCDEYGMSINESVNRVRQALQVIDPLIQQIMDRMIEESPFPGIPCVWDRPPSIRDGSVRLLYWTKIKPDLEDACVGISPIDAALPNVDFDGD